MFRRGVVIGLLGFAACGGELRVVDISDIGGPALAFIVDIEDRVPTQLGSAILIDENGRIINGKDDYEATGASSHVIAISQSSLLAAAGFYRETIRSDEFYTTRLALLETMAEPFQDDAGAWLPLRLPSDVHVRPMGSDIPFSDMLQVELPIHSNYSCSVSGDLVDFNAVFGNVSGGVPNFNDFSVVSSDRVLALTTHHVLDLRLDAPLATEAPGPRLYQAPSGTFLGQIQANPRRASQLWVTERTGGDGTLREFFVDEDGFFATTAESFLPTNINALGVMSDGTPVASGSPPGDERQTNVHVFDGLSPKPKVFPSLNVRHRIEPSVRADAISLGLQGTVQRLENGEWTSTTLVDNNGVAITPRGLAERRVGDAFETWTVGDEGRVTRRLEGGELTNLFVPVPPGFRCQEGGDVVATNMADVVIYQNRFALIAMETCSDVLVIDLDNPDCTSLIRYAGPAASFLVNDLQIHGDRLWLGGDRGMLRYADLEAP